MSLKYGSRARVVAKLWLGAKTYVDGQVETLIGKPVSLVTVRSWVRTSMYIQHESNSSTATMCFSLTTVALCVICIHVCSK
jgi:hypothetical protein